MGSALAEAREWQRGRRGQGCSRKILASSLVDRRERVAPNLEGRGHAARIERSAEHACVDLDHAPVEPRCDPEARRAV